MTDISRMNEAQRLAVTHGEGPLLLLAGPGSGKTFTITQRILYLLEKGTAPERILVITFTKDAAVSMQQRFRKLSPSNLTVNFGTFHSVFYHMLKESGSVRTEHPLDQSQKKKLLLPILKVYSGEAFKELRQEDTTAILNAMSFYKNTLSMEEAAEKAPKEWREAFPAILEQYEAARERMGAVDFDDMVCECRRMLSEQPRKRQYWQNRFDHILMDEFQDINPVQYETVKLLAKPPCNLFAVGDDDQAIYGFRGAQPECLKRFAEEFNARQLLLNLNYRSCAEIIAASGLVIGENKNRFPKDLRPAPSCGESPVSERYSEQGKPPISDKHSEQGKSPVSERYSEQGKDPVSERYSEQGKDPVSERYSEQGKDLGSDRHSEQCKSPVSDKYSEQNESLEICKGSDDKIKLGLDNSARSVIIRPFADQDSQYEYLMRRLKDFPHNDSRAVLFRTNAMMQGVAARLRRAGIPYVMKERVQSIYEHFIVRDIMSYLLLAQGKWSRERFLTICNRPSRYISREAMASGESLQRIKACYAGGTKQYAALDLLERQLKYIDGASLKAAVMYICKVAGYEKYLKEQSKGHPDKWMEWQEMLEWVKADAGRYGRTEDWLAAQEEYNGSLKKEKTQTDSSRAKGTVWLMTVHGSKGLEFDHVLIPDCNEKVFPHGKMPDSDACEEERRIFYVAMTRAAESLELLYLNDTDTGRRLPSRFLTPLLRSQ